MFASFIAQEYKIYRAKYSGGLTPSVAFKVDPSIPMENFDEYEPTVVEQLILQANENSGDIVTLDNEVVRVEQKVDTHIEDEDNPHAVTAEQVDTYVKTVIDNKDADTLQQAKEYTDILDDDIEDRIDESIDTHNESATSHEDIRLLISTLNDTKLNKNLTSLVEEANLTLSDLFVVGKGSDTRKVSLGVIASYLSTSQIQLFTIVEELPTENQNPNTIYLLATENEDGDNQLLEYIWIEDEDRFELIGSVEVDLSDYYNKTQVDTLLNGKLDKVVGATRDEAYSIDASGAQKMTHIAASPIAASLALRSTGGIVRGGTPVGDTDLTPKLYVDTQITNNKQLFFATFGTTTFAEITQALADGKLPIAISGAFYYTFVNTPAGPPSYYFQSVWLGTLKHVYVSDSDVWGVRDLSLELQSNKVQTIDASSTTTQFPSAKAVWDLVSTLQVAIELTQAEYDAIAVKNPNIYYIIVG